MDLTSMIILVTGGGSGIGLDLTRQLVALGNTGIICGRDAGRLAKVARLTGAQAIAGNVTRAEDQDRILSDIRAQHGRLDLLINNAGNTFFSVSNSKRLADLLPNRRFAVIAGADHYAWEDASEVYLARVLTFIAEIEKEGR